MRIVLAASAALLVAMPATAATFPTADPTAAASGLQAMRELNLIVFGNLNSGHEVEGKTFVGGNVSGAAENFGIGNSRVGAVQNSARATLTVGGNVSSSVQLANGPNGTNGQVSGGSANGLTDSRIDVGGNLTGSAGSNVTNSTLRTGGSLNAQNYNPNAGKTASYGTTVSGIQPQDAAFVTKNASLANTLTGLAATIAAEASSLLKNLTSLSNVLSSLTTNATVNTSNLNNVRLNYGASAASDAFVVANVSATDLFGKSGSLFLDLLTNGNGYKTTIINVTGLAANTSYAYMLNNNDSTGSNNQNIIWNFNTAAGSNTSIALNANFGGSVLAPYVSLSNSTQVNGSVVAGSFNQGGEVHLGTFAGTSAIVPTSPVPEPSTWALMLTGFGAIGVALRRRARRDRAAIA